jgi:phosphatidate phosphatase APP1
MALGIRSKAIPIRVEPFFGFRDDARVSLTVRALRSLEPDFSSDRFISNFRTMWRLYTSREVPGLAITLSLEQPDGETVTSTVTTDSEGFARFDLPLETRWPLPMRTAWEEAVLEWSAEGALRRTPAHILAPSCLTRFGIISDIDDTILETGITGDFKAIARNWKRVMAQMPHQRRPVDGVSTLFAALAGPAVAPASPDAAILAPRAHERPVFYVSSSPWNLFTYLNEFKRLAQMPAGPALLRDWGFNRRTLGRQSHSSHKIEAVSRIVDLYREMPFVLVGDDTQKDLVAFAALARRAPERVCAVLIRQVSRAPLGEDETAAEASIRAAGVRYWTGPNFSDALGFLESWGLIDRETV